MSNVTKDFNNIKKSKCGALLNYLKLINEKKNKTY